MYAVFTCPPLEELANAEPIEYDDDPDVDGRYPFGTEAFFHCERGYKLKGPYYNSCYGNPSSTDGVFGPYPPTCKCEFILIVLPYIFLVVFSGIQN